MWDICISQREGRADTLVQQVPGEDQIDVLRSQPALIQQLVQRQLLHFFLRLLPGPFPEFRVHAFDVKAVAQGPLGGAVANKSSDRKPSISMMRFKKD